ncbi:hypothetical protein [uncultured Ruegeria sp.]|uniref:sensor histidine kinase n=1 Tax=uncultured Ruegeria sp. TaxID=259304 RepID=UPI0026051F98|nr:hypothetical protein [uncultured Ruegeria sp.]
MPVSFKHLELKGSLGVLFVCLILFFVNLFWALGNIDAANDQTLRETRELTELLASAGRASSHLKDSVICSECPIKERDKSLVFALQDLDYLAELEHTPDFFSPKDQDAFVSIRSFVEETVGTADTPEPHLLDASDILRNFQFTVTSHVSELGLNAQYRASRIVQTHVVISFVLLLLSALCFLHLMSASYRKKLSGVEIDKALQFEMMALFSVEAFRKLLPLIASIRTSLHVAQITHRRGSKNENALINVEKSAAKIVTLIEPFTTIDVTRNHPQDSVPKSLESLCAECSSTFNVNYSISGTPGAGLASSVAADAVYWQKILFNVFENYGNIESIDFVSLVLKSKSFELHDNGDPGAGSRDIIDNAFKPFWSMSSKTGLGLSVAHAIATKLGWRITIQKSDLTSGMCFEFKKTSE